ncbi:YusG family protein [Alkalihalophilus pseudofirmus]|uniref:YusG family protein n=1 Tax=Alkalihalophilus pseudofirmus TaxID=79885 RepID=UPI00259B777E|nr:YusG family protein [Alkalihalophilus pseudofirmus]WEG16467.1 YusG family protein [Alkalihalophilus pseudofirmus]
MDLVKVDVTSKVKGKYENGHMNLYVDDARIGQVTETEAGLQHIMSAGYIFEEDKVYRYEQTDPNQVTSYVDSCEEGWC